MSLQFSDEPPNLCLAGVARGTSCVSLLRSGLSLELPVVPWDEGLPVVPPSRGGSTHPVLEDRFQGLGAGRPRGLQTLLVPMPHARDQGVPPNAALRESLP